ncbi:MAG: alpha/beta fold hydrolase, partial [Gemmatimonadetes bacterium]|nr:alpha/beta fold hydrolase [Gemmatimonadota bacterium]
HPGVVLIGHSAGGAAALVAAAADPDVRRRVRALVVVATPVPWLQGFRRTTTRLVRRSSLLLGRFPARLLRLGPEDELPGVMAQWMTWNLTRRWTGDDGTDYVARIRELPNPALFVAGAGDRLEAPPHAVQALYELAGSSDKTFLLCGRSTGFSADFDHAGLVVSRTARAEVWPKILAWLLSTLG